MVNQYYFYLIDQDFGPLFIKFGSYFPYTAKLYINGHEWLKRQLKRQGLTHEPLDNGILSCADPLRTSHTQVSRHSIRTSNSDVPLPHMESIASPRPLAPRTASPRSRRPPPHTFQQTRPSNRPICCAAKGRLRNLTHLHQVLKPRASSLGAIDSTAVLCIRGSAAAQVLR